MKFVGQKNFKAFLLSSGTESTEAALKIMRMYSQKIKKEEGESFVLMEIGMVEL